MPPTSSRKNNLHVRVRGTWPDSAEPYFALSIYVFNREDFRRPGFDRRAAGYPDIIDLARDLMTVVANQAFRAGYLARIDVARVVAARQPWPRWCYRMEQFETIVQGFRRSAQDQSLDEAYPISIWFIPSGDNAEAKIALFRELRFDQEVLDSALETGAIHFGLTDLNWDVLSSKVAGNDVFEWFAEGARKLSDLVSWAVEPGE